ncbi:D-beta-D-heptose 7-phosphate kinase / D-beta-D-heptose 1-phosphate adenosyltransferase [Mucilaginibacter mallensis]|uniref:D-glycero-beta-D-manno-heptose 1-phosphate adenylyltransferase n=1 Tax=Mucilaginibacter mallensis TaxID=652787 RepID=A0A1H1YIZ4_MUCMA|nr:D-glycero-beta-D-manno-heptose 1-phosphate adenylyltransferase [Mucilaginibacter mallensis]SDT21331.1 D-beta-D-heptose 7-phosphate kinase / D-beta-D-heptose 1-phosphate adenosyltransferase [Mucilaginibacter mallensis]
MRDIEKTLSSKINELSTLKTKVAIWKSEDKKVVFTNGVFDLIHIGHITYLSKAAELGDKLIIGLNSDASVKRIKGESRPVNGQDSRAALLASFFFVDAVVVFEEDTPLNLITTLMPDVLIKGADYSIENIVGAKEVIANGGEVKTITFVEGYSSTSIIKKIQQK